MTAPADSDSAAASSSDSTLADWAAEGACRAPDECWVALDGTCPHGLASWQLVLDALAADDASHRPR